MQETSEQVVEKSVTVSVPVERAFEVFTAEIATWWPLKTHSVADKNAETVVLERRAGGRFYERTLDGKEHLSPYPRQAARPSSSYPLVNCVFR